MEYKDYYKILGVDKKATKEEIKKQYRKLARKYHPDINPNDPDAHKKFSEINEAHEVLADDEKKEKYDNLGSDWKKYQSADMENDFNRGNYTKDHNNTKYTYYNGNINDFFGEGGFSDFFKNIFGDLKNKKEFDTRNKNYTFNGADFQTELMLLLNEAYSGCSKIIDLNGKKIRIKFEPGIRDGQIIKLKGKGAPGINGGKNGDLYITIKLDLHPQYKREGNDLFMELDLNIYKALLGGEIEIQTFSGKINLKIKPETQNGTTFRLKGRGFPFYGNKGKYGDLYIKINLKIPENITEKEKILIRELAELRNNF